LIVGQFAPLLFSLAFKFFPVALQNVLVHSGLLMLCATTPCRSVSLSLGK
jgi:hypothetical protein